MTIQNISQYGGLYSEYPVRQIPNVSVEAVQEKNLEIAPSRQEDAPSPSQLQRAPRNADLENISLTFLAEEDFGYIGTDSDIESLDVRQAVSDMQKDSVLQQYQTFVGVQTPVYGSEDGLVFMKGRTP